jgi:hypothetical protein
MTNLNIDWERIKKESLSAYVLFSDKSDIDVSILKEYACFCIIKEFLNKNDIVIIIRFNGAVYWYEIYDFTNYIHARDNFIKSKEAYLSEPTAIKEAIYDAFSILNERIKV